MKPQDSTERLRALCLAPEPTSWLVIQSRGQHLLLRRRYYPWLTGLFCFGLMGGLCFAMSKSSPPSGVMVFACIFSVALAAFFVISAAKGDRKLPLLDFETATGILRLPSTGESFSTTGGLQLGIQHVDFVSNGGRERSIFGALYVMPGGGSEPLPVFVEPCRGHLRRQAGKFAALAGLEVQELPSVSLSDTALSPSES